MNNKGKTTRLEILESSLSKKKKELDRKFDDHFSSVKQANGQPLNDKKNGQATIDKWNRQSDGIRRQISEIEKTESAIERETQKINECNFWYGKMPEYIKELIDVGKIKQWRKHPRMMFVVGVENARLVFDDNDGLIRHRYVRNIPSKEQYAIFRDVFNSINLQQRKNK